MRRGSVSTWENFGRRNSASMAQFTGEPAQFMTTDDIKYRPTDGWFVSYKRATTLTILFIFGLIVSGLIGWYIHSIPVKRIHEELNLIDEESLKEIKPISPNVRPLKYWLYFKPTIMDYNNQSNVTLTGRVVIEFRIDNDTNKINKLSLNAVNINVKRYELLMSKDELSKDYQKRYKRTNDSNVIINKDYLTSDNDTTNSTIIGYNESNNSILSLQKDSNITMENGTYVIEEKTVKVDSTNGTLLVDFKVSKIKDLDWFSMNGIGKGDEIVQIKKYEIDHVNKVHLIHPKIKLKSGVYFLTIYFDANPTMDVFYNVDSNINDDKTRMMGTLLKTAGSCSHLFPIFNDELYLKAIFSLTVERPKEMKVLSNMPLRSTKDDAASDNWLIDMFDETPLMTPNNLAFVMGNLKVVDQVLVNSKLLVTFWAEFDTTSTGFYMLDKFEPIIIGLTDILSVPYWLPKLDLICLPWKIVESSGNLGLISIKKSLFYTDDRSPLVTKTEALKTLIGLLGEQWLGGRVSVKSWTNEWLLKGSLLYFQHLLIDKIDSSLEFAHSFVADIQTKAMEFDGYSSSRPFTIKINPLRMISNKERNRRGACLIRMLHGALNNDTAFRIVYKNFLTRCQNESIDATEFWNFMNEETGHFSTKSSFKNMIDSWITQGGYPFVNVSRNYAENSATVGQKKFTYDEPTKERNDLWDIPLTYVEVNDDWSNPKKMWLLKHDKEQIIRNISMIKDKQNEIDWILVNVNKTGYYRVNYDEKNWQLLAKGLEKNPEDFPTETRASLVDDVFALAAVGFSKYETAFGFIKYMQMKERHYATWNVLTRHVFKLNNILYESSVLIDFQEFMQKFITPLYNEVGNNILEGSPLTLVTIKLACISEYFKCIDWAKQCFIQLKTNPNFKHTIPMYIRRTLYCTIAKHGGLEEWNYIYQKARSSMKTEEKYNLLSSFGCFQMPGILQSIIDEILQDDIYNTDEICMILKSFSMNPIASRITYKFIINNWTNITDRYSDNYKVMKSFILAMKNGITNGQDLTDLHNFWDNNYESIKTVKYAAALVESKSNFAISLINNYSDDIKKWLKDHNDDSGV